MKRIWIVTSVLAAALAAPSAARADVSEILADVARKTQNSSAAVSFDFEITSGETQHIAGQAICILKNAAGIGTFITFAYRPDMKPETIQNMKLTVSGPQGKVVPAEFLTVEPLLSLVFLRAKDPYEWMPVTFHKLPVQIGQTVVSVGLMSEETGYQPYFGMGYVSTSVRVPEPLVRIVGGTLTNIGSPVFDVQGRAIGIVGRQLASGYVLSDGRQSTPVSLRGQEDTLYFTPTEVFAFALENVAAPGKIKRLPWLGVLQFSPSDKATTLVAGDKPSVKVGKVIPGQPADKAGLRELDVIVGLNGQPLESFPSPDLIQAAFVRQVMAMHAGDKVTLSVLRGGQPQDIVITLTEMPTRPFEADQYPSRVLGFAVRDRVMLDDYLAKDPLPNVPGVLVIGLAQGSPAVTAGLQSGDIIQAVGNEGTATVGAFKKVLEQAMAQNPNAPVNLTVRRGTRDINVAIQPAARP